MAKIVMLACVLILPACELAQEYARERLQPVGPCDPQNVFIYPSQDVSVSISAVSNLHMRCVLSQGTIRTQ